MGVDRQPHGDELSVYDPSREHHPDIVSAIPNWPTAGAPISGQQPSDALILAVNHYVRLLIIQYSDKPKAQGLIALWTKQMLADDLADVLLHAFDLGTAVGPQLDVIGKYVGLPRNIGAPTLPPFFSVRDYNSGNPQGLNGFCSYDGSSPADGAFYSYDQSLDPTNLTDSQYGFMILLKIGLNHFDGTLVYIQQFLQNFLEGFVEVTDNQDMTLTYTIFPGVPVSQALLEAYLPKPMAVGINLLYAAYRRLSDGTLRRLDDGTLRIYFP
jgi:hypothetical protein